MNSCSEDPVYWVILTSHLDSRTKCQGRVTARAIFNSQCAELLTYREECNSWQMSSPVALSLIQVFLNTSGQKWLNLIKLYKRN